MCLPFRRRNLCATCSIATPMRSTTILTSPSTSNTFSLNSCSHLHVIGGSSMCSSFRSFHSRRYHHKSSSSAFSNLTYQHSIHSHLMLPLVSGVQLSSFCSMHVGSHAYYCKLYKNQDRNKMEQLTDLIWEGLFGKNTRRVLTGNGKNVAYYNRFLESVDLIGQNLPPQEELNATSHNTITTTTSSSSSVSASCSIRRPTSKSEDRKLQQKRQHHHRRVVSYGLAYCIKHNGNCGSLDFEKFYRRELPYYCGVKDAESERFIKQWSKALSDADFRHYLSTTVLNVIKKARRDVKDPFSVAAITQELAYHKRQPLASISAAFSRVLVTKEDVESLESCNIKFYELFVPSDKDIALQAGKVSVISGASGSGKTITALAAATREPADVVFYTGVRENLPFSESEALETTCTTSEQKTRRNKIVKDWVMEQINKILDESHYALLVDELVPDYKVVIVVDNVGCCSGFLAGLCASLDDLSIELHNKFFLPSLEPVANKKDWHEKIRIRFIAAGSGASLVTSHATSNPDRYDTYFIGKRSSTNTDFESAPIFATILKRYRQKHFVSMLKRLDPEEQRRIRMVNQQATRDLEANPEDSHRRKRRQEAWITPTEKAAADLVTNARCAALLVNLAVAEYDGTDSGDPSFATLCKFSHPRWWKSAAAFNKRLQLWIPVIIQKYISMNAGLRRESDPVEIIRHALAATIFRLPCLPFSGPWLSERDSTYAKGLIDAYGVLVDYAKATKSSKGIIRVDDFVHLDEQPHKCALKVDETTARYYTSPAHVVMFRSGCGLTLDRPPELPASSTFKYDIAEFCALTLICASAYHEMVDRCNFPVLDWKTKKTLLDRFDEEYNYKYDSLFGLKKKLARDSCGATDDYYPSVTGATILHLFDSPLISMHKYIVAKKKDDINKFEKSARAKATMLRREIEASLSYREAVVIISREMEQFADVIVVSRGRVMLIQCKQKLQPRKNYLKTLTTADNKRVLVNGINWIDEIEKMCGLDSQSMQHSDQKSRAEKMRNIYLDELKSAAAAVRESPDVTKVKVELVFLVEGEKAVCNLFAEDFKRLQVTDENSKDDNDDKNLRPNKQMKKNDQQLFPTISAAAKTISAEKYSHEEAEIITVSRTTRGYPVSFFGVHRRRQATTGEAPSSSSHSYPPPLFPVPDYSEDVQGSQDTGCSFAIGEHQAPYEYTGKFWITGNRNPYEEEY